MNLLRGTSATSVASLFEIRIDSTDRDVIVMRGLPLECTGAMLKGKVVLSLHETIQARNITLSLRGKAEAAWNEYYTTGSRTPAARQQREDTIVYETSWSFLSFSTHTKTINPGNYEYPFEVMIPGGNLPLALLTAESDESVEGLDYGSVRYTMVATIERPTFNQNIVARKHLRLVRTLSVDSLEMAQTLSVDNTWPNKIEYAISIPTKSYPIGSSIPMNFKLVPLLKGLCIAKITCTLKEYQTFSVNNGYHGAPAKKDVDRTIATCTIDDLERDVNNWELDEVLSIPSGLTECVQDCDVKFIKVRHKLKFTVALQNPDGHVSELRAALPVSLLIPPSIFSGVTTFTSMDPMDPANQLPSYDHHIYDRLYDGVETPLPSGTNTPAQSRSRRGSIEGPLHGESEQQRRALMAGLSRLTMSSTSLAAPIPNRNTHPGSNENSRHDSGHNSTHGSGSSTPYSRSFTPGSFTPAFTEHELEQTLRNSAPSSSIQSPRLHPADASTPAPFTQEEMESLNRVPTYGTATTRANAAPLSSSLPEYQPQTSSNNSSGTTTPAHQEHQSQNIARPSAARTASHRTGVLRTAHDRLTRARERDH